MREEIQKILDGLAEQSDPRISVFDLQIQRMDNGRLSLKGSVLSDAQLADLKEALSPHFPDLDLETASIDILRRPELPLFHVGTNTTGFHEKPTFSVPLVSELTYGTELEILKEEGRWIFASQSDGYLGWAYKPYLTEGPVPAATHLVLAPSQELRSNPDGTGQVITRLMSGTGVLVEETQGKWSRVAANKTGWIPSMYLRAIENLPKTEGEKRKALVEDAQRMTGVPYLWGGMTGNGIDCSGLARLLHHWIGMDIPRDADMQCSAASPVKPPFEVGDLFFFAEDDDKRNISHVGMSLGGWDMVHSSRSRNGVYTDNLKEQPFLMEIFVGAGSFIRT
jgi:gamma-D-glutamyl-L-lysine dipeptidyl-peptidase